MGIPQRLIVAALLLPLSGCMITQSFTAMMPAHATEAPAQVVVAWNNKVTYVPDPAHNGTPAPGICGRVYLFGPIPAIPLVGDGSLVVDLFDDTPHNGQPCSVQLEEWQFDPVTFRRLLSKDTVGSGYTIFLPWGTYRPDVKYVHLAVRYEPANGTPLYAPSGPLTLDHSQTPVGAPLITPIAPISGPELNGNSRP
jgi:hypothetical protein